MAAGQRPRPGSLGERLRQAPQSFELLQALLVLEQERPSSTSLACGNDPRHEVVRLRGPLTPVFAPSQISRISYTEEEGGPPQLVLHTPVFGLGGPDGPLPYAYQEWLQQRARDKDEATAEFLDLFQHRLLSLLYRVQRKHRLALPFCEPAQSPVYRQLLALNGLTPAREQAQSRAVVARTALFANRRRSLAGLHNLISQRFGLNTRIEGFQGAWRTIPGASQSVLGRGPSPPKLGRGALIGRHVWDQHAGIRITLGPLDSDQVRGFLPEGADHRALGQLVAFYLDAQLACSLRLLLKETAPLQLQRQPDSAVRLGWGSWLKRVNGLCNAPIELQLDLQQEP